MLRQRVLFAYIFHVLPPAGIFYTKPLFISLGMERGLTENLAAFGVMLTGVASASGRLLTSWFSDYAGRKGAIMLISLITLASSLVMIFAEGVLFLVCISAIAFCFGCSASVYAATAEDLFGTKHMGINYGCVMVGFGVSALIFPIISNLLSSIGVYTYSFLVAAAGCAITLILIAFLKITEKVKPNKA